MNFQRSALICKSREEFLRLMVSWKIGILSRSFKSRIRAVETELHS